MVRDWRTSAPCFSGEVLGSSDTEGLEGTLPGGEDPREGVEGEVVSKVSADGCSIRGESNSRLLSHNQVH